MVNFAVSSYYNVNVLKLNTAYYTTGIYKKQLLFLIFIECLELLFLSFGIFNREFNMISKSNCFLKNICPK